MIDISAHISAANNLKSLKSSVEGLVSTLRSAQNDIYPNEVDGLDSALSQLENMISSCLSLQNRLDALANSIIAAAWQIYNEELAEQRRLEEELNRKAKETS